MSLVVFRERDGKPRIVHPVHSRVNHDYHMAKFGRCVYCDNNIPLSDEELVDL